MHRGLSRLFGLPLLFAACSCGSSAPSGDPSEGTQPTGLSATADESSAAAGSAEAASAASVVVKISQIDARAVGDEAWTTVSTKDTTVDLLSTQSTTFAHLGVTSLPSGSIHELRMFMDHHGPDYVRDADATGYGLVVPWEPVVIETNLDGVNSSGSGNVALQFTGESAVLTGETERDKQVLRSVVQATAVVVSGACPVGPGMSDRRATGR
jgi:hypothetical protein